jgi:hypothetical protein
VSIAESTRWRAITAVASLLMLVGARAHAQRTPDPAIDSMLVDFLRARYDDRSRQDSHARLVRDEYICTSTGLMVCPQPNVVRASRLARAMASSRSALFHHEDSLLVAARAGVADPNDCTLGRISWLEVDNPVVRDHQVTLEVMEVTVARAWRCFGGRLVRSFRFDLENGELKLRSDGWIAHASIMVPPQDAAGQIGSDATLAAQVANYLRLRYDDGKQESSHGRLIQETIACDWSARGRCTPKSQVARSTVARLLRSARAETFSDLDSLLNARRIGVSDDRDCSAGWVSWLTVSEPVLSDGQVTVDVEEATASRAWRCEGGVTVRRIVFSLQGSALRYSSEQVLVHLSTTVPPTPRP